MRSRVGAPAMATQPLAVQLLGPRPIKRRQPRREPYRLGEMRLPLGLVEERAAPREQRTSGGRGDRADPAFEPLERLADLVDPVGSDGRLDRVGHAEREPGSDSGRVAASIGRK